MANDGVDYVLECTGFYASKDKAQAHLNAGLSGSSFQRLQVKTRRQSSIELTIIHSLTGDTIVSAGSCTTNCLAPMADALDKEFGVEVGTMTTVHAYTSTQMLLDGSVRGGNLRAARSAAVNTIPILLVLPRPLDSCYPN